MMERIKYWRHAPFSLTLWDLETRGHDGKWCLRYRLRCNGKVIFEGSDYRASPLHCVDSIQTVAGILTFLSLRPGDTDKEYFAGYTPEQIAWRDEYAEDLSVIAHELTYGLFQHIERI